MRSRISLLVLIAFCAGIPLGANAALAQNSVAEFHNILRQKAQFDETDFAALEQGQTVVRLLPAKDKREVAVCGLVNLQVPAEFFLQSFLETMSQKTNPAILEIGSFSDTPTLADLQALTIDDRDIEDLRECVTGDCKVKLSARMIERLHTEVDWVAADYRVQATRLLKLMLLEYVHDYLARGDDALIEYHDKAEEIRLAEEQRALMGASPYVSTFLQQSPRSLKGLVRSELSVLKNAIVWSKIKFGFKPVIAFNHITVYKRHAESGPQILVASKQIYANHYFDSSLALTAFVNIPGPNQKAYLFYENRSRANGLEGAFSKIKRGIVEARAVDSLKTILQSSRTKLNARSFSSEPASATNEEWSFSRWRIGRGRLFALLVLITAFATLFTLSNYKWKTSLRGQEPH